MLSGLKIVDVTIGDGPIAERRAHVTVRYSGFLSRGDAFQADVEQSFVVGERKVIAGLSRGVEGMRVGGRRRLVVSPHLAYREPGAASCLRKQS